MVTAAIRREITRMTVASISASVTGHPPFTFVVHERDEKPSAICCPSGHIYSIIAHIYLSIAPNNFAMRSLARLHPALAPPVLFPAGQKRAHARRKRVPGFFSMGEGAPPQRRLTSSEDESGDCGYTAIARDVCGGRARFWLETPPDGRLRRRKKTRGAIRQTRAVPPPSCGRRFLVPDSRFPQKAAEPPAGLYRRTALRRLGLDDCGICRACR